MQYDYQCRASNLILRPISQLDDHELQSISALSKIYNPQKRNIDFFELGMREEINKMTADDLFWSIENALDDETQRDFFSVSIWLDSSDEQILAQVKKLIQMEREKSFYSARRRSLSKSDFSAWKDSCLIQYCDIRNLIDFYNLSNFSQTKIANLVFPEDKSPNDVNHFEKLRKVTLKYFKLLIEQDATYEILCKQNQVYPFEVFCPRSPIKLPE